MASLYGVDDGRRALIASQAESVVLGLIKIWRAKREQSELPRRWPKRRPLVSEVRQHLRWFALDVYKPTRPFGGGVGADWWQHRAAQYFGLSNERQLCGTTSLSEFARCTSGVVFERTRVRGSSQPYVYPTLAFDLKQEFGYDLLRAVFLELGEATLEKMAWSEETRHPDFVRLLEVLWVCDACKCVTSTADDRGTYDTIDPSEWYCRDCFFDWYGWFPGATKSPRKGPQSHRSRAAKIPKAAFRRMRRP
mmetsp:Transcript_53305/g.152805  ORF Transcript_53305/g.152805 Transcript_53305/m.152805 type:complete len:250 (+) Transcript_53305:179-928(+)